MTNRDAWLVLVAAVIFGWGAPGLAPAQTGRDATASRSAPAFQSLREQSAQVPILRRVVAVELRAVSLQTALERIATSGGLRLTYSADILPQEPVVSLRASHI
jgi:hypothetical protein